jgi:hypothetical protein
MRVPFGSLVMVIETMRSPCCVRKILALLMTECRVDAVGGLIAIDNVCRNCPMSKNERGGILVVCLFVYLIPAVLQDLMTERLVVRAVTC